MRVVVLVLAMLLLPLRGWLGDAMALQMTPPQQQAQRAATASVPTDHAAHAMHATAQAPGDAAHHDGTSPSSAHASASSHAPSESSSAHTVQECQTTCTNCQLCHSLAVAFWPEVPPLAEVPRAAPAFEPIAFASAEPAPGFKPPIS